MSHYSTDTLTAVCSQQGSEGGVLDECVAEEKFEFGPDYLPTTGVPVAVAVYAAFTASRLSARRPQRAARVAR